MENFDYLVSNHPLVLQKNHDPDDLITLFRKTNFEPARITVRKNKVRFLAGLLEFDTTTIPLER